MAAERAQFIDRIVAVEGRLLATEGTVNETVARMKKMTETMVGLGDQLQQVTADMTAYTNGLAAEKTRFADELNQEFDGHKRALAQVVNDARGEFDTLKSNLTGLYGHTAQGFTEVKARVEEIEQEIRRQKDSSSKVPSGTTMGFIPIKSMVPAVYDGADEKWRGWQEDIGLPRRPEAWHQASAQVCRERDCRADR